MVRFILAKESNSFQDIVTHFTKDHTCLDLMMYELVEFVRNHRKCE